MNQPTAENLYYKEKKSTSLKLKPVIENSISLNYKKKKLQKVFLESENNAQKKFFFVLFQNLFFFFETWKNLKYREIL